MKTNQLALVAISLMVLCLDISGKVSATEECHAAPITEVPKPCVDATCKAICSDKYQSKGDLGGADVSD
ncbi:Os04g0227700 [Oryza sativa Japonica Group]|uniref:Os04g0227700 protein n=1 Tax=Oryza sativa subsp. japonica TaxID=39947 RepID=C7J1G6_ORYSJ|nr:Os04g0227700 [Oryza sativa Japonica Group]|eukprot:NP_001173806.1 Os04g0227700 [Oryza sativa Japonica Group]